MTGDRSSAVRVGTLGFPRIGMHRELKTALEAYWDGRLPAEGLEATATSLRARHWRLQRQAGVDWIPSNDFSLYDHVLDAACLVGAVPARFAEPLASCSLDTYFAMARGRDATPPMAMTKWFDTNYHYIVPEFEAGMAMRAHLGKVVREYREARALGIDTRPVLIGPVTLALLGRRAAGMPLAVPVQHIVEVYRDVLRALSDAGASWVQFDEPCFGLDLEPSVLALAALAYESLAGGPRIFLATYFSELRATLDMAVRLPIGALHLDLTRGPSQLARAVALAPRDLQLSLGVVSGRNVWRTDLDRALGQVRYAVRHLGASRVQVAPSCSLLHVPLDASAETALDPTLQRGLAFAVEKLAELRLLADAATADDAVVGERLAEQRMRIAELRAHPASHVSSVRARTGKLAWAMYERSASYPVRRRAQARVLSLPTLPTTTIGSLPQTASLRKARAAVRQGQLLPAEYHELIAREIQRGIRAQEKLGLDVLVHGEFERGDMVEYFAEQLDGIALTRHGWVQSYGSRCVKPPLIHGDVQRRGPMTVKWSRYAQSLTSRPVKGMLTGPNTLLKWSFVRDDLPPAAVATQLALAIRDEVQDLEAAGLRIIQVDEPALREGLPLREDEHAAYLAWAVAAFRLATGGAAPATQIHTHMCYSAFADVRTTIAALDADVVSIEAARSELALVHAFRSAGYPNAIGPGVYDVHSPRVPSAAEVEALLERALAVFTPDQLWVNPDCGLKTRRWEEILLALANVVTAARRVRSRLDADSAEPSVGVKLVAGARGG